MKINVQLFQMFPNSCRRLTATLLLILHGQHGQHGQCVDPCNESLLESKIHRMGKINCLDMSLKPDTGIPRPRTVHELLILLEMQHTDGVHAFKMADKIARKEGHRQVFVEYVNEIADNSRDALFFLMKFSFKNSCTIETGVSDFHRIVLTQFKITFQNCPQDNFITNFVKSDFESDLFLALLSNPLSVTTMGNFYQRLKRYWINMPQ